MGPVLESSNKGQSEKHQVLVIGDAMIDHQHWIDHLPKPGEDTIILSTMNNVGGSGANTAIALAYLGAASKFYGTLGRDQDGEQVLRQMRAVGVDISGIQYADTTGFTLTMIDKSSERTMYSYRGASANALMVEAGFVESLRTCRIMLTSGYQLLKDDQAEVAISAAERVKAEGNLVALDPCPLIGEVRPEILGRMLALTDMLMPNFYELTVLTGEKEAERAFVKAPDLAACVVIKMGVKGARMYIRKGFQAVDGTLFEADGEFWAPAIETKAVDTTGAGDSFNAGFLASYLRNEEPEMWLKSGNSLASEVVRHRGAVTMFDRPLETV